MAPHASSPAPDSLKEKAAGRIASPTKALSEDEKRLNELGYRQEYRRVMTPFQQWAYTFSYTAPLGFITGYYGYMYSYGGPVSIFWGFLATTLGTLCMAFAMSEVISAFPTLGSVYYWVAQLVPKKHAAVISWFVGWIYLLGSFCGTALNEYLLAQLLGVVILLATGGAQGGGYKLSNFEVVGVTAALFVLHFFVSIVKTKWLGHLSSIGAWFQILSIIVIVIILLVISPRHQSAKFVFTHFVHAPGQGIKSAALVVLLGLPYAQSILTGFEVGSHVVEEVKTAAMAGPRAMIRSVYVTAGTEFILLVVMTFCIQYPQNLLDDKTATGGGDVTAGSQIFYDCFEAKYQKGVLGACIFTSLAAGSLFFGNITNVTLTARMAYAMARDKALPGHRYLAMLTKVERIPVIATVVTVVGSFLCTLPSLGSSVAFTAITAMSTITAYGPYTVVLICRHAFNNDFKPGPFSLGRWGIWIGGWGAFWGTLMSLLFCLPPSYPVTGSSFNYAAVSLLGCMLVGAIYWVSVGRKNFYGPRRTIDEQMTHNHV
ncbi:hypothetical protein O6H91_17G069500 [Diphasiastrum complanatum]|uniref:Uncharacterized protein n=2 Tax=Diphasiastrum complanatum TaxID=34168 RepID=A0ACC2B7V2_DIPCM|nr:hypothetical protein O6H91_17G068900 [Diphasiastrum complanatum]KAJ7525838.1 hypothetical protein O6H91_17G069500 [Diphasiastrum complanatum]